MGAVPSVRQDRKRNVLVVWCLVAGCVTRLPFARCVLDVSSVHVAKPRTYLRALTAPSQTTLHYLGAVVYPRQPLLHCDRFDLRSTWASPRGVAAPRDDRAGGPGGGSPQARGGIRGDCRPPKN